MTKKLKSKEQKTDQDQDQLLIKSTHGSATMVSESRNEESKSLIELEEPELEKEPDISVFRPDREGVRKVLGDLEADIMEYIWDNVTPTRKWITVRDVYEAFKLRRTIAYTTVMSTMARLGRKRLLQTKNLEGAYGYTPSLSKQEFINNFVTRILENLLVSFSHTAEEFLNQAATPQSKSRIAELRAKMASLHQELNSEVSQTGKVSSEEPFFLAEIEKI